MFIIYITIAERLVSRTSIIVTPSATTPTATSVKRARKQQFWQVNYSCAAFDFDKRSVLLAGKPSPQMVRAGARVRVYVYMCVLLSKAASCGTGGTSESARGCCCRGRDEDEKPRLCPDSRPLGSLFSRGGNVTIHHCLLFLSLSPLSALSLCFHFFRPSLVYPSIRVYVLSIYSYDDDDDDDHNDIVFEEKLPIFLKYHPSLLYILLTFPRINSSWSRVTVENFNIIISCMIHVRYAHILHQIWYTFKIQVE